MAPHKMLKAAAVLITVGYCSLLVFQGGVPFNFQESSVENVQVSDLPVESVTITDDSADTKITLDDIFITVKTTKHYQDSRLPIILKTWFQLAKDQTWFFTDTDNPLYQRQTNGHMVNTNCSDTHQRQDLCCKTSVEYNHFVESSKKWFCHFDDDNYVNVPRLVTILQRYNHQQKWYLGQKSYTRPVYIRIKPFERVSCSFSFATGGAGYCISRSLAFKMLPITGGARFINVCELANLPDDCAMGFIVEHVVKNNLTVVPEFHSHLEEMKLLPAETFQDQISFGYSGTKGNMNVVNVPGFNTSYDPTRFLSLHCFLFPHFKFCPR